MEKTRYLDAESCARFCAQAPMVCDDRACGEVCIWWVPVKMVDQFIHVCACVLWLLFVSVRMLVYPRILSIIMDSVSVCVPIIQI